MSELVNHALQYRERGWSIIPIGADKKSAVRWTQYQSQRVTIETAQSWFSKPNVSGVAVVFGAVSGGLASRDFDDAGAYQRWAQEHPKAAMTLPTVKTARGFHVYFCAEHERFARYQDGEYRGDRGHYSLLPPSVHPSGTKYQWTVQPTATELPLIDPSDTGLLNTNECNRADRDNRAIQTMASVHSVLSVTWFLALDTTLPRGEGQRNACLWSFARMLKFLPQYAEATANQMEPMLREWHRRALPYLGTKSFDETRIDFNRAWERVKFAIGNGPIEELMKQAKTLRTPKEASHYDSAGVRQLVTLCALLQAQAGGNEFFLSCRKAADVLGVNNHVATHRWMGLLRHDGLLVEVEKGKQGRASRWRWTGSNLVQGN